MVVHASLWRVVVYALILSCLANVLLWRISSDDDTFATIIGIASGVAAVMLAVAYHGRKRWLGEALLLTFSVWMANAIEFALQDGPRWESQVRQDGFYLSFALLALGAYVAQREASAHG